MGKSIEVDKTEGTSIELVGDRYTALDDDAKAVAKRLGYSGMFGDRDSIKEAYDYLDTMLDSGEKAYAMIGVSVLMNSVILELADKIVFKDSV